MKSMIPIGYFALYIILGMSLLLVQPFGNPPDESAHYLIPQYIAEKGTLPNGYEEEIRIYGYGFSYGFQPILPYIIQGFVMRFVSTFILDEAILLYIARGINLLFGFAMAYIVLLLSRQWFADRRFGWLFSFLVTFLPQNLFMHTYVNTDSCCMLSTALMLYGLTLGLKNGFGVKASLIMSMGIILCALSYYNAYGYIVSCMLLFTAYFFDFAKERGISFDGRSFLAKGGAISAVVLAGAGWWFIRSAVLHDGDFFGLQAREHSASLYAIPEFHPDTRVTWQNQGFSIWDMLKESDFIEATVLSFIGIFGPMAIAASIWVYRFFKYLFIFGIIACLVIPASHAPKILFPKKGKAFMLFWNINMVFCILMPLALSLLYSYTVDYQPQGRYVLPALIPLSSYCIRGLEKLSGLSARIMRKIENVKGGGIFVSKRVAFDNIVTFFVILGCILIAGMTAWTIYGYVFPYYQICEVPVRYLYLT